MSKFTYYQDAFLNLSRDETDPMAEEVIKALFESGFNPQVEESYSGFIFNADKIPKKFPLPLQSYFRNQMTPATAGETRFIEKGSRVFQRHAPSIMAMLGVLALPYCYASEKGVQVLYHSERIRNNPGKRLLETASFVLDVCRPNAFGPRGKAYVSIAKVRLMHAAIRYYVAKSSTWQLEWGKPINQEDMAGTNLAFSLISIRGLRKLGHEVDATEGHDFIQLWNYIGKLLGIKEELLPDNNREAFFLEKKIRERTFKATEEGKALTSILIDHLRKETKNEAPVEALMHYLLEENIAKDLGIKTSKSSTPLIGFLKIINLLKGLQPNDKAYQESIQSFKMQQNKYKEKGMPLQPYRLLKSLRDKE